MNPPKNDQWPTPKRWRHVWVRLDKSNLPPLPGLVLDWRREGTRWSAWVVWVEEGRLQPGYRVRQAWIRSDKLRPATSDINVWNDGPWR